MLPLVMAMATFFRYVHFLCVILSKEGTCRGPHSRSIKFSDKWHRITELRRVSVCKRRVRVHWSTNWALGTSMSMLHAQHTVRDNCLPSLDISIASKVKRNSTNGYERGGELI